MTSREEQSIREHLKAHGLRYSRAREVVLRYLSERNQHLSAQGLYFELKQRGQDIGLSTVYLTLNALKDVGLIREVTSVTGEAVYDTNVTSRHHFVCHDTGQVVDLPEPLVETIRQLLKDAGEPYAQFELDEIELRGRC